MNHSKRIRCVLSLSVISAAFLVAWCATPSYSDSDMYAEAAEAFKAHDYVKAVALFEVVADTDNNDYAQGTLASIFRYGRPGVPIDLKKSLKWAERGVSTGRVALAFEVLGMHYEFGDGVTQDRNKATMLLNKAVALGDPYAARYLADRDRMYLADREQTRTARGSGLAKSSPTDKPVHSSSKKELGPINSDVDHPQFTMPENPNNFAVVIGIEDYSSLPVADYAKRDAEAVQAHLRAMGYPTRNIYFLTSQQATRAKIEQSLNTWLPRRVGKDSTVFFYYSGHGAPDPQTGHAFLVPADGDADDLESTAYPIGQLYAKLSKLKVRQVIVALDSCFSGTGGRSVLAKGTRPLVGKIDLGVVPANIIALTASDKSQISGTIEGQGHGAFTYYLLKGLGGAANDKAGNVTIQSLYDYLTPKVQDAARLHNRDQTPQLLPANSERAGTRLR